MEGTIINDPKQDKKSESESIFFSAFSDPHNSNFAVHQFSMN